jgi:hypothetical protein
MEVSLRVGTGFISQERSEMVQTDAAGIWRQIMAERNQLGPRQGSDQTLKTKKRRLPEGRRRFFDHDVERGIALSLAGLAATYSPRA